jgi:hypothetical protein
VPFWRRRETLNEKLLREAGAPHAWELPRIELPRPADFPEAGITGVARVREWDTSATVEAPQLRGDEVEFVVLPDRSIIVDEELGDASLEPLANAIEETLPPPYRARGLRQGTSVWAVGARRIAVVELSPDVEGDTIELTSLREERTLTVDGARAFGRIPQLEGVGETRGADYALRAARLEGPLWQVDVTPL